ncbi:tetraacyldisaccharide 4'-kinase [Microvirga sp. 2TAF3]|uniref:tetraacyldisaccharide 4'-kinase n=1 Tax=Microvirga sp. 2TAF3 TaxID=3233014 RepID=UPI003F9C6EC3
MRAPAFWWRTPPSLLARLLRPASLVYGGITGTRMKKRGEQAGIPIVCIGNFTAGGAGKTPTALAVAEILDGAGESPAFLSRGYKGKLAGPVQIELHHTAADVGDEPLLLASMAPTIVSRDRPAGARLAIEAGATVVIMDDGLQNPSLTKDCTIAVVDGASGIGNGLPIPSGPLRAPMPAQWPAVDAILIIGAGAPGDAVAREAKLLNRRVFRASLTPDAEVVAGLQGKRVLAFAGIGKPEKFFETLRACGAIVEKAHAFPDHHVYGPRDLDELQREARLLSLQPVTTEKDLVRIEGAADLLTWPQLMALPVRLRLKEEAAFRNFILRRIGDRRIGSAST